MKDVVDMQPLRVLLVEQSGVVADGLRMVLEVESDIVVVGLVGDGYTAIDEARRQRPHVVVIDGQLPGLGAVATTRCLRALDAQCHILLLLVPSDAVDVLEGIRAGATGVLLKTAARAELVEAVHVAARGEPVVHRTVLQALMQAVRHSAVVPPNSPSTVRLTAREQTVLRLVVAGLTNAHIAERLTITVPTVKRHLSTIYAKLNVSNRYEAVAAAHTHAMC